VPALHAGQSWRDPGLINGGPIIIIVYAYIFFPGCRVWFGLGGGGGCVGPLSCCV